MSQKWLNDLISIIILIDILYVASQSTSLLVKLAWKRKMLAINRAKVLNEARDCLHLLHNTQVKLQTERN